MYAMCRYKAKQFAAIFCVVYILVLYIIWRFKFFNHILQRNERCINCQEVQNITTCQLKGQIQILLVVLIVSEPENANVRDIIRSTWLNETKHRAQWMRYAFVVGNCKHPSEQLNIHREHQRHKDLVAGDFQNSCRNSTLKTLTALKWATTQCSSAKYIMKTEEDVYLNLPVVLNTILDHEQVLETSVIGHCLKDARQTRFMERYRITIPDKTSQVNTSYCTGPGYIMTQQIAREIYTKSNKIPKIYPEDIYIGMCIQQLPTHFTHNVDCFNWNYNSIDKRSNDLSLSSKMCLIHTVGRPYLLKKIWQYNFKNNTAIKASM